MLFTAEEARVSVAYKRGRTESAAVVQKNPAFVDSGICDLDAVCASLFVGNETKLHVNRGSLLVQHHRWLLMLR